MVFNITIIIIIRFYKNYYILLSLKTDIIIIQDDECSDVYMYIHLVCCKMYII